MSNSEDFDNFWGEVLSKGMTGDPLSARIASKRARAAKVARGTACQSAHHTRGTIPAPVVRLEVRREKGYATPLALCARCLARYASDLSAPRVVRLSRPE